MKKFDYFSAEKNINTRCKVALFSTEFFNAESINYGHSALHGPAAHIQRHGYGATWRSAEKNSNTRRKVALFSATALACAHVFSLGFLDPIEMFYNMCAFY